MPTIDELFKSETKSGYSLDELFSDKSDKNKFNIDQLFSEDNKQTLDPSFGLFGGMSNLYNKIDKAQQQKTPLDEAFGGLSNAEIIAGKKKEDSVGVQKNIRNPLEITQEQLKEVWQEELGVSKENRDKLKWLLGDPDNTLLGKANNYLFDTGSKVIDGVVRTGTSVGMIASGLSGDILNTLYKATGNDPGGAGERLTRDLNIGLMEIMGRSSGFKPSPKKEGVLKSEKTGKEFSDIIEYAKENAEQRKEVIQNVNRVLADEVKVIKENNDIILGDSFEPGNVAKRTQILDEIKATNEKIAQGIPEIKIEIPKTEVPKVELPKTEVPIIETTAQAIPKIEPIVEPIIPLNRTPSLQVEIVKKITEATSKFFKEENIKLDPKKPISLQLQELWQSGQYDIPTIIRRIAEDNKITYDEFTSFIYPSARQAGQELAFWSKVSKEYKQLLDPNSSFDTGTNTWNTIKRLDNIRRGSLVTRLSTTVRNYISQSTRVGLDVLQSGLDLALQQAIRPFVKDKVKFDKGAASPLSSMQGLINNFTQWNPKIHNRIKQLTNQILDNIPTEKNRLFLNYASDVKNYAGSLGKKGILNKAEGIVDFLNIPNKTSEYITRRAVFLSRLDEAVKANNKFYKNKTLEQLTKDGELKSLRPSDIAVAVDKALDATFSKDFAPDSFATAIIRAINKAPFLLTGIIPYPRFLMNAIKFQYDYSPLGILSMLSKESRSQLAKGNTSILSKATIGTGMILAGYALRNQSYAGEKWYEFKSGDRTFDVRPFNPFAGYLFLGDVIKRYQEGTLRNLDVKGIASVLFGIRGTTGVYLVDSLINFFTDPDFSSENFAQKGIVGLKRLLGETAAGYLTPFQNFTDVYAQFFPEARAVKETGGAEFTGAFTRRFPGSSLPTLTSPTSYIVDANGIPRAAPIYKQDPLLTQVTGLTFMPPKNPAEKELDRLGFESREIFRSTGIPELDRAYKDKSAVAIGFGLSAIVSRPEYQALPDSFKSLYVKKYLESAKSSIKQEMQKDTSLVPYITENKLNSLDKDTRRIINDVIGKDFIDNMLRELKKVK